MILKIMDGPWLQLFVTLLSTEREKQEKYKKKMQAERVRRKNACESLLFNYLWLIYGVCGMEMAARGRDIAAALCVLQK